MTDAIRNRIHLQDCIAGMASLPDGCIDLAFADPPFNIGYKYDVYDDRLAADEYLEWSRRWIAGVIRVLKPDGTFWLAIGDEFAAEFKVLATRDFGLHTRSWVVWYCTFGVNCKYKFTRSHAHLFYFVKDPRTFTFNHDEIRVPSARQLVYADKRSNPKGRLPDDTWIIRPDENGLPSEPAMVDSPSPLPLSPAKPGARGSDWILRPQDIPESFLPDEDTWYYSRVCGTFGERKGWHGCQMPERILERIIRACSKPGELVLDPFSGSGTTLAVAKKLGRQFLGFELSPKYAARAQDRLKSIAAGDPIDGVANPLTSAPDTANGRKVGEPPTRVRLRTRKSDRQKKLL